MKVKMLDQPIMLIDRDKETSEPIWYEKPISESQVATINVKTAAIIENLRNIESDQVSLVVNALLEQEEAEPQKGVPWTIRRAMISTLYATRHAYAKTDAKGQPKPEKQDVIAQMQAMGYAFQHAPKMGFVVLDADDMQLVRRKMYELPLPGLVAADVNRYLDQLEEKTKTEVVFGVEEEDAVPDLAVVGE